MRAIIYCFSSLLQLRRQVNDVSPRHCFPLNPSLRLAFLCLYNSMQFLNTLITVSLPRLGTLSALPGKRLYIARTHSSSGPRNFHEKCFPQAGELARKTRKQIERWRKRRRRRVNNIRQSVAQSNGGCVMGKARNSTQFTSASSRTRSSHARLVPRCV